MNHRGEDVGHIRKLEDVKKASLPIVALTANVLKGDSDKYLRAGMNDYLSKPVGLNELGEILKRWVVPDPLH